VTELIFSGGRKVKLNNKAVQLNNRVVKLNNGVAQLNLFMIIN